MNTQLSYETAWRLRVSPRFGRVLVRRIRSTQIEDWLAELTHEGMSASKVIEAHGVHKRVLDRAVRDGAIALNPCAQRGLPLPRPPSIPVRRRAVRGRVVAAARIRRCAGRRGLA